MTGTAWKVRHEGSPQSVDGLSVEEVLDGLREGQWEPTDEVVGPNEQNWTAIENHPQLAEAAADIEPPGAKPHDDETNLDMNPLIDVALVLLVFFILTASYESVRKVIEAPSIAQDKDKGPAKVNPAQVKQKMIRIKAFKDGEQTVIQVEGARVEPQDLQRTLAAMVNDVRNEALIDSQGVDWGTLVMIQDAARAAGIVKGHFLLKPQKAAPKAE
jgi:biopolymer transport protein ExbD